MLNRIVAASILASSAFVALAADEPAPDQVPVAQTPQAPVKTGKERLSSKASDEQRVDNCKVPQELRGTTVRSDICEGETPAIPTN